MVRIRCYEFQPANDVRESHLCQESDDDLHVSASNLVTSPSLTLSFNQNSEINLHPMGCCPTACHTFICLQADFEGYPRKSERVNSQRPHVKDVNKQIDVSKIGI